MGRSAVRVTRRSRLFAGGLCLVAVLSAFCGCGLDSSNTPSLGTTSSATIATVTSGMPAKSYTLLIHCGVKYATFDGSNWITDSPVEIPPFTTDPISGVSTSRYSIHGTMVRKSANEAEFTTTDEPLGVVVVFHLTNETIPPCA